MEAAGDHCGDIVDCHREQNNSDQTYRIRPLQYARCQAVLAKVSREMQGFVPIVFAHCPSPQASFLSFSRH